MKRELFDMLSTEIGRQIRQRGGTEEKVFSDFESSQKSRRETRWPVLTSWLLC